MHHWNQHNHCFVSKIILFLWFIFFFATRAYRIQNIMSTNKATCFSAFHTADFYWLFHLVRRSLMRDYTHPCCVPLSSLVCKQSPSSVLLGVQVGCKVDMFGIKKSLKVSESCILARSTLPLIIEETTSFILVTEIYGYRNVAAYCVLPFPRQWTSSYGSERNCLVWKWLEYIIKIKQKTCKQQRRNIFGNVLDWLHSESAKKKMWAERTFVIIFLCRHVREDVLPNCW